MTDAEEIASVSAEIQRLQKIAHGILDRGSGLQKRGGPAMDSIERDFERARRLLQAARSSGDLKQIEEAVQFANVVEAQLKLIGDGQQTVEGRIAALDNLASDVLARTPRRLASIKPRK